MSMIKLLAKVLYITCNINTNYGKDNRTFG